MSGKAMCGTQTYNVTNSAGASVSFASISNFSTLKIQSN